LVPDQDAKARIAASGFLQHEDISSFNWFFRFVSNEVASWEPEIALSDGFVLFYFVLFCFVLLCFVLLCFAYFNVIEC